MGDSGSFRSVRGAPRGCPPRGWGVSGPPGWSRRRRPGRGDGPPRRARTHRTARRRRRAPSGRDGRGPSGGRAGARARPLPPIGGPRGAAGDVEPFRNPDQGPDHLVELGGPDGAALLRRPPGAIGAEPQSDADELVPLDRVEADAQLLVAPVARERGEPPAPLARGLRRGLLRRLTVLGVRPHGRAPGRVQRLGGGRKPADSAYFLRPSRKTSDTSVSPRKAMNSRIQV